MQRPEEDLIALLKKQGVDFTASLPCEKIKTLARNGRPDLPSSSADPRGRRRRHLRRRSARRQTAGHVRPEFGHREHDQCAALSDRSSMNCPWRSSSANGDSIRRRSRPSSPWGRRLPAILAGAGITYSKLNTRNDIARVERELQEVFAKNRIHAFLMSPEVWEGSECWIVNVDAGKQDACTKARKLIRIMYRASFTTPHSHSLRHHQNHRTLP